MATGDILAAIENVFAPPTSVARADPSTDGSQNFDVLLFDDTTPESYDFSGTINNNYNGTGNIVIRFAWFCIATPDGSVTWEFAFRRMADGHDMNLVWTPSFTSVVAAQAGAADQLQYDTISLTNAQLDGVQPGEIFAMRIRRPNAADQSGDAALVYPKLLFTEP